MSIALHHFLFVMSANKSEKSTYIHSVFIHGIYWFYAHLCSENMVEICYCVCHTLFYYLITIHGHYLLIEGLVAGFLFYS